MKKPQHEKRHEEETEEIDRQTERKNIYVD